MVKLSLSNHNRPDASPVILDLLTGLYTLPDGREVTREALIEQEEFSHPLLDEPYTATTQRDFHYTYDDFEGLVYSATFVYKTLLHAKDPSACTFTVSPSKTFKKTPLPEHLYFSINPYQKATQALPLTQLERLIQVYSNEHFEFSHDVHFEDTFSLKDLPQSVDADKLYDTSSQAQQLLKTPPQFDLYELRYIDPAVGFGIFCRQNILKGQCIGVYNGIKKAQRPDNRAYLYCARLDVLGTEVDARPLGNLTRFINHAPTPKKHKTPEAPGCLAPNIATERYPIRGIEFVFYIAKQDILPGEQLLVDYGLDFFKDDVCIQFKPGQKRVYPKKTRPKASEGIAALRIMANEGIHEAKRYLLLRSLKITLVILGFAWALNHLRP